MSKVTIWFIKLSLVYLVVVAVLGAIMGIFEWNGPLVDAIRPVHVHLGLLGWMSMMIYGVGYHVLPRFAGKSLYSDKLAMVQFWTSNIGLLGMSVIWPIYRITQNQPAQILLIISFVIEAISIVLFVYNLFKTIKT